MKIKTKYFYSLLFFCLVFSHFTYFYFNSFLEYWISNNSLKEKSSKIKSAQEDGNFSITLDYASLVWIECQVTINLTSDTNGIISIRLQDSSGGNYFSIDSEILEIDGSNQSYTVQMTSHPQLLTPPGNYEFFLDISGVINYNETFNILLGMGYLILLLVYLAVLIAIPIILTRKVEEEILIPSSETIPTIETDSTTPAGKIKCPECRKEIDEGLTFCPECGSRIPEFLKYSPD